jgi:receptor protein-tyrosine kinase
LELKDYLRIVRRGWLLILTCVVGGAALGVALIVTTTKVYEANVQLFVATAGSSTLTASDLSQGNNFTQNQVQSYTSMATSPAVTEAVIQKLGLAISSHDLVAKINASAPLNKVLINIGVRDRDPDQAASLANAVADEFSRYVAATVQTDSADKAVVKLTVIHPAVPPQRPVTPKRKLDLGLGVVLGLVVGLGLAILRDVLDNTVKGPEDFEALEVPVLGLVPFDKRTQQSVIAFRDDAHGTRAEAYRQMRTNLQFIAVDHKPKVIAITSAVPAEGKSTTSLNLAAALAEAGSKVILVEADLRRPSLGKALGLSSDVGFTTTLIHKADVEDVVQSIGPNLDILTSGPIPPNPSELLMTDQAKIIIGELREIYDYVIIDTPPLLPVTDGAQLAATIADATVLVYRAGKSSREAVKRCLIVLDNVGVKPVGAILNMITKQRGSYYDYSYGYYYSYRPKHPVPKAPETAGTTT